MESGYSVISELPPGYTPDFVAFLFHLSAHLKLQSESWEHFFLAGKSNKKVKAQLSVHVEDGAAISPVKAPFGSIQYSNDISPEGLYEFIGECEERLRRKGVRAIRLVEPPLYYRESGELLHTLFYNRGYRVTNADLSCGLKVDSLNFEEKLSSSLKRRFREARDKGLRFKTIPSSDLELVYRFIDRCGTARGHALSMTLENLQKTVDVFKDRFFLFGAMLEKELVAASVAIQVHPNILYMFYLGHEKKYDAISPVVFLTGGMYKVCETRRIHLLDLGTSASNGQPNFGLLDFKLRMGGTPSMKLTFEKQL